jgi:hypothetical protein
LKLKIHTNSTQQQLISISLAKNSYPTSAVRLKGKGLKSPAGKTLTLFWAIESPLNLAVQIK